MTTSHSGRGVRLRSPKVIGLAVATVLSATLAPATLASAARPTPSTVAATITVDHPWAKAQPTATGRAIVDLAVHDGKVYAGYGDYGANTGPITLAGYDPATGTFEPGVVADTEAVYNLRSIGGELLAPSTDPRQSADYAKSGPWENVAAVGATHVYDMATLTGTDRWMVGSKGSDAVAWHSPDGGVTWAEALRMPPTDTGYNRFYFAGVLQGRLYVQSVSSVSGPAATSMAFDGMAWEAAPSLLPAGGLGWAPLEFNGALVLHAFGHGYSSTIYRFDGASTVAVGSAYDLTVDNGLLYLLQAGRVTRSADGVTWTLVTSVPETARSLAIDGQTLWVGTIDSQLQSIELAASTPSTKGTRGSDRPRTSKQPSFTGPWRGADNPGGA